MMYATKIKMKPECGTSNNLLEIDEIYIEGAVEVRYYKKEAVHDAIKKGKVIKVKLGNNPNLLADVHPTSKEKYVRSEPNDTQNDNLLKLPRK